MQKDTFYSKEVDKNEIYRTTIEFQGNKYKVFAQAMHNEKYADLNVPTERRSHLYNMITFIVYDVHISEGVIKESAKLFMLEESTKNNNLLFLLGLFVNLIMGVIILILIEMMII